MKDNRRPGLSLLDYLWTTYGQYKVSDNIEENDTIPSTKLLKEITSKISNESISSLKVINNYLTGFNKSGELIFSLDISEIVNGGRVVTEFGKKYIEDSIPVYFLKFSDNSELLAPIDEYTGLESSSVVVNVLHHQISADIKINNKSSIVPLTKTSLGLLADLKIANEIESILLTKELEGLKAKIILDNSGLTLKFKYLSLEDYNALTNKDVTTVYFIKNKKYFYFGDLLIGEGITNLDNYYTKQEIDENLATKQYVEDLLSDVGFSWKLI